MSDPGSLTRARVSAEKWWGCRALEDDVSPRYGEHWNQRQEEQQQLKQVRQNSPQHSPSSISSFAALAFFYTPIYMYVSEE